MNSNQIGYCAVVVPASKFWQGYFIDRRLQPHARGLLDRAKGATGGMVQTIEPMSGVNEQEILGAMSAVLVEGALTMNMDIVGSASMALHLLTKQSFFMVIGEKHAAGTKTTFKTLSASTISRARDLIDNDPIVRNIKREILADLRKPRQ